MCLKVFEAFAGYGSQRMALKNIGIDFEVVGISEIEGDVITSYASIHTKYLDEIKKDIQIPKEEMVQYLENINTCLDYKTFQSKVRKLSADKLKKVYIANILSKNYGDIKLIDENKLPDFDLFTYSFPCQDISVAGYQNGLDKNSGTRSSLLWECVRIIKKKKPKYLLMENVKNLVGTKHKHNFLEFLDVLKKIGYKNYWSVLNARDYGVPQNRERVFCVSILNSEKDYIFPVKQELKVKLYDLLEKNVGDEFYLNNNQVLDCPIEQEYSYCLDSNYWKGTTLASFLEKHRRQLVTDKINNEGKYTPRKLTPRETWRLMGVKDDDIDKAMLVNSKTALYKQSGNSIVVNVLEAIFHNLFLKDTERKE